MTNREKAIRATNGNRHARIAALLIALSVAIAFGIDMAIGTGNLAENGAAMLRFFTVWGGVASGIIMGRTAMGKPASPPVMAALVTAVTVIGVVYWTMLATDHHPQGIGLLSNQIFHTLVPVSVVAWWLRYAPVGPAILSQIPVIIVPPIAYGVFTITLGKMTGFYAYFFLDLPKIGWVQFALTTIVLVCFFAVLGAALLKGKAMLSRLT